MKFPFKELAIALTIGIIIGLIVMYGIKTANQAIRLKESSLSPVPTDSTEPSVENNGSDSVDNSDVDANGIKLSIVSPELNEVYTDEQMTVRGTSTANTNIFIFGEKNHALTMADDNGDFSADIDLVNGINYLKIYAVSDDGISKSVDRTVILTSTEF